MSDAVPYAKPKTNDWHPPNFPPHSNHTQTHLTMSMSNIIGTSVAVTPSDTVSFATGRAVGLYIGGAGNVVLIDDTGTAQTFTGLLVGHVYPFACTRVNATNTTATNIRALYSN